MRKPFAIALFLGCAALTNCAAQPPVVSWEILNPQTTLNEPVFLRLRVRNLSAESATLDLGQNWEGELQITVVDPKGEIVRTPVKLIYGFTARGVESIDPGMAYARDFVVNEWYNFDRPGSYGIGARLLRPILVGKQPFDPPLESNQQIQIGPRDEAALQRTCERLFSIVSGTQDKWMTTDKDLAMKAFRTIHDPIAIPYLLKLSKISYTRDYPMYILHNNFTTPDGIEALLRLAYSSPQDAELAKRTVLEMAKKVEDPMLRDHIYESLGEPKPR